MLFANNVEIDVEVAMHQAIAHSTHLTPWHVGMAMCKFRISVNDSRRHLANGHQAHDDRLLGAPIGHESAFRKPFYKR